jgi:hypothetical protein
MRFLQVTMIRLRVVKMLIIYFAVNGRVNSTEFNFFLLMANRLTNGIRGVGYNHQRINLEGTNSQTMISLSVCIKTTVYFLL